MIKIENLTTRPVLLALSSGITVRLSPGDMSLELEDVEVQNNPKINKLRQQRVIAIHLPEAEQPVPAKPKPAKSREASARSIKKL